MAVALNNEFNKEKFCAILKKAIGTNSYSLFAKKAGLSWATIAHYATCFNKTAPNEVTIIKIASASEGRVTESELMEAAGYTNTELGSEMLKLSVNSFTNVINIIQLINSKYLWGSQYIQKILPNGPLPTDIEFEMKSCPFEYWYIKIFLTENYGFIGIKDSFKAFIGDALFAIPSGSPTKLTFIIDDLKSYEEIRELTLSYDLYITLVLFDLPNMRIIKEEELNSPAKNRPEYSKFTLEYIQNPTI